MDSLATHLRTLGLTEQATLEEAHAAYKDLIRVWHPDRFESDPKLRAKAEAQTREINLAISEVRTAIKNKRPMPSQRLAPQQPLRQSPSNQDAVRFSGSRTSARSTATLPTLAIHQAKRVSLYQTLSGLALLYVGLLLIGHFANKGPSQAALGVVLVGHGFSTSLLGLSLLCLKRPVITINQSFLRILGTPAFSLIHIEDALMVVSRQGSYLSISCTPEHLKTLPFHLRWTLKVRRLLRNNHFEFKATALDAHPAHVIDMLDTVAFLKLVRPLQLPRTRPWGSYANAIATLCLGIALVRCLVQRDTSLMSLGPSIILFLIFRTAAIIKTVVLAPSR